MIERRAIVLIASTGLLFLTSLLSLRLLEAPLAITEIPLVKDRPSIFSGYHTESSNSTIVNFRDETFVRGITHKHAQKKMVLSSFEDTLGSGVCIIDINNDGWDDLFFITGSGNRRHFGRENWWSNPQSNRLYLNKSGEFFEDITEQSGITEAEFGLACAATDLDNDGLTDLIVANKGGNSIYKNLGNGKLTKQLKAFTDDPNLFSTSILIKDFNGDGLKDILFGNYVTVNQDQNILELNAGYQTQKNINFDPALYDAQPDTLFVNKGSLTFTLDTSFTSNNGHGRTLGFYEDGSILALNDKGSTSQIIYRPEQNKNLQKVVLNARDASSIESPGNTVKHLLIASDATKGGVYALELGNHESNDKSWDYGINREDSLYLNSWAVLTADFNNDGNDDIFLTNGSLAPHPDTEMTTVGQPNSLLIANKAVLQFDKASMSNERILSSRGAAYFDFNNDGALDIAINNNNDFASLLINQTSRSANWIGLKCIPSYLCEKASIVIDNQTFADVFKPKRHFMSQSTAGLILQRGHQAKNKITVKTKSLGFSATLSETNLYYLIDLNKKTVNPVKKAVATIDNDTLTAREELIGLIRSDTQNKRTKSLNVQLANAEKSDKLSIIHAINKSANHDFFPLIDAWAQDADPEIAATAIDILKKLEAEESVPTLINLLKSENSSISCAASRAFEYFYWKDEAVIERKNWGIVALIRLLEAADDNIRVCAIDALSESESFRALQPLMAQLNSSNEWIVSRAARALGMLRQTAAIPALQKLLFNHPSPIVRAQTLVALIRLNSHFDDGTENKILQKNNFFNAMLTLALRQFDDGVTATKLSSKITNQKLANNYQFLEYLSASELNIFYKTQMSNHGNKSILEKVALSSQGKLSKEQFTLLTTLISDPERMVKLFLALNKSDQNIIFNSLSNTVLKQLLLADAPTFVNHCKMPLSRTSKDNPCKYLSKLENASLHDMAKNLRLMINSGLYETTYLVTNLLKNNPKLALARNQLFSDTQLLESDKLKIVVNFPLDLSALSFITNFFPRLHPQEQIDALIAIENAIPIAALKPWLVQLRSQPLAKSTQFHIQGILANNNQEKK